MKRYLFGLLGVLALGAYAVAQTITVPVVTQTNQNDLIQIIPNGRPVAGNVYVLVPQLQMVSGYYKQPAALSVGNTYTFGTNIKFASFINSGTLDTATVTMPAAPSDGARVCFVFLNTVTTLTVAANAGQSINNAASAAVANTTQCYLYSAANKTWDRAP